MSGAGGTMTLTAGNKTGKTVVRSSRMTSRTVLEHFAAQRDPGDMTRLALGDLARLSRSPAGVFRTSLRRRR